MIQHLILAMEVADGLIAVLAAAGLGWMGYMARQLSTTATANKSTADLVDRLAKDHDRLRSDFDAHVSAGRERYVGQLEQQLAQLREDRSA